MAGDLLTLGGKDQQVALFGGFDQQGLARMRQRHRVGIALKADQAVATGPTGGQHTGIDGTHLGQGTQSLPG